MIQITRETMADEGVAVKRFLQQNGYQDISVTHGKGTAWGSLRVRITVPRPPNCACVEFYCQPCRNTMNNLVAHLTPKIERITGRSGDAGRLYVDVRVKEGG